jgi:hypothetical protein
MLTTIFVIVVISVIVFGSTTNKVLEVMNIQADVDDEERDNDSEHSVVTTKQEHWFISFDNRFLKPFFTCQKEQQYVTPHDHWHNENDHVENLRLVIMNKSVDNENTEGDENNQNKNSTDTADTCTNVEVNEINETKES